MGFLKVGAFALVAFGIALYSVVQKEKEPIAIPTEPAALLPVPVAVTVEGTIVYDNAPASDHQLYVRYAEQRAIKTKRLVLPARYACHLGDLPCSTPTGAVHPFASGDRVLIEGTADADLLYVHRVQIMR